MVTDVLNKPVAVGDYVVLFAKHYRNMVFGRVVKITPKQVRVISPSFWSDYLTADIVKLEGADIDRIPADKKLDLDQKFENYGRNAA